MFGIGRGTQSSESIGVATALPNDTWGVLQQEIVGRYYYQRGKVRKNLVNDVEVKAAINLLNDRAKYNAILSGK